MARNVPPELATHINRHVLNHIATLSAHSDVAEALATAVKPLGDVRLFCPDPQASRYVAAATRGVIFSVAFGMNTVSVRLDERMKDRAVASGAAPDPACGVEWVSFTLFRDDWPKVDLEFWVRKAYVAARELSGRVNL